MRIGDEKMSWEIEMALCVLVTLALIPATAYALSLVDLFFTRLESGNIKYIFLGETLLKIIADVRGKRMDGHKLVAGEERRSWWNRKFGIYLVGIPFLTSVKKFTIKRRKEHEDTSNKPMTEWIRDLGELEVDSLRAAFPRPFLLEKVELGDRQTVNLLVVGKFVVVDAYIPIVELKGEFFELTSSTLKGAVVDILKDQKSMNDFNSAPKGEGGILEILTTPTGTFNQALEKRVGLHLVGITIPEWSPSETKVREAMSLEFIAEKERGALNIAAQAYKEQLGTRTEADANRVRELGIAQGSQIREKAASIASLRGTPDVATQALAEVLVMEAATSESSKITTLVKGGNTPTVIPIGGEKK